jgi:hypothetical protein
MKTDYTVARRIATLTAEIDAADRRVAAECSHRADDNRGPVTCGACAKSWPADIFPSARCPYEYEHTAIAELATLTRKANNATREAAESIAQLRAWLPPGATVYCILQHVSRSGMSRRIKPYAIVDGRPQWLAGHVSRACGLKMSHGARDAIVMGGCGMDMGFALVYEISQTIWGDGYPCMALDVNGDRNTHRSCPSNYHSNHRDRLKCEGVERDGRRIFCAYPSTWRGEDVPADWPRSESLTIDSTEGPVTLPGHPLTTLFGDDGDYGREVCPTCGGAGDVPNPDGPERFDLIHRDGYALRHEWL